MAQNAPGKHYRMGLTLIQLCDMFPDNAAAERWFAEACWPDGPHCPHCGSLNVQSNIKHKSMTHRCRDCPEKRIFSLKTGTVMEGSKLGFRTWAIAVYVATTNLKGVSSMKLHRDLASRRRRRGIWRIASASLWRETKPRSAGRSRWMKPTWRQGREQALEEEAARWTRRGRQDDRRRRQRSSDRHRVRRSGSGTDAKTLQGFVEDHAAPGATVYTDDAAAYRGMRFKHEAVKHSVGEYVDGMAHTNGIESFWALLKRGYHGTYHHMSEKHLGRYVNEFAGRHNERSRDTLDQMQLIVDGMVGKRLRYKELIA